MNKLELQCPKCGKKSGRAVKNGRVCVNCGYKAKIEEFIISGNKE